MTRIYLLAAQRCLTIGKPAPALRMLRLALAAANREGSEHKGQIMAALSYARRIGQ